MSSETGSGVLCGQARLKYLSLSAAYTVESAASVISLARLETGQDSKLPFHQGHLWGKGLAAGGRRLEDASDAHSVRELGCLLACQGVGFVSLRWSYSMPLYHCSDRCKQRSVCVCVCVNPNLISH